MGKYTLIDKIRNFFCSLIWKGASDEECYVWSKYLNCVFYRTTFLGKLFGFKIQKLSWEDSTISYVEEIPDIADYVSDTHDEQFKAY